MSYWTHKAVLFFRSFPSSFKKMSSDLGIMFWKYNTNYSSSQIESLLAKEDVTLQEVMDSEDIINECKVQNKSLIDFLQKPEVMDELVTLISKEPSIELEEQSRFKYPNIACELLTCDVPALNERLASNEVLLDKLYTFLDNEPPLNSLLASYFSKVMGALIAKKTEQNWISYQFTCLQVLDFLKAKDTFISLLLKHLGTSAIMDLMLKLMTQVEGVEMRQNILNWLDSQRIMQSLVSLLSPEVDKERHYNVAQLLCDFIRIARDTQRNTTERADPDPLLNTLESSETISLLLDHILGEEKSETAIVGGIQVLLALLDIYQNSSLKFNTPSMYNYNINDEAIDLEHRKKITLNTSQAIKLRLKNFHSILVDPPKQNSIPTTLGTLDPPLGNTRLQVTKLFAGVISSNNDEIMNEMINCDTFSVLLDLFFKYQWNNFLHTQVENCLMTALKNSFDGEDAAADNISDALSKHLLVKCKVIEKLLDAWKENDEQQAQEKGIRKGYMGHVISMVNRIVEMCSNSSLGQYLKDNLPEVSKYLEEFKETTLEETNKIQATLLGGAHPNTSSEENEDYQVLPYQESSALQQQMFAQYQMQNLTPQFIDGYGGYNDDHFNDGDDTLQTIDPRSDMNFDLSEGDLIHQQEIFKQVCAQNINTWDDADDQIFEEKEHTFQTVIEKRDRNDTVYSSDSDEDAPGDDNMDVDPWTSPKPSSTNVSSSSIASEPWPWHSDLATNSENTVGGWADFSSAAFDANFSNFNNTKKDAKQPSVSAVESKSPSQNEVEDMESREQNSKSDLKLETTECQTDVSKALSDPGVDKTAQTDGTQMHPDENGKSAAGDQPDESLSKEGDSKCGATELVAEPSKSIEGDCTPVPQSGPTANKTKEEEKV